jgi:L-lactate dehydrogenase (cytochrome)
MVKPQRILSLDDLEPAARRHLPRPLFGYVSHGTEDEVSHAGNRAAFGNWRLRTRVLVDVSRVDQSVDLLGQHYASPFAIAPIGLAAVSAFRGDMVLARAATTAGIPMIVSGSSLIRMEEIAQVFPGAWFQAYLPGQTDQIDALLQRVAASGFGTLVITADTPVAGNRENHLKAGFSAPLRPSAGLAWQGLTHPSWLLGTFMRTLLAHGMPHFENNYAQRGAPIVSRRVQRDFSDRGHLNWGHFEHIRRTWKGKLVLKGVLHAGDARRAREVGADAIVVSNHGGRQLDGAVSPLQVLPEIVRACPELPVLLDGGVRRGADVLKALALGARAVLLGRPFMYAAAVGGEAMVARAIELLRAEVARDMAMLGITTLGSLDAEEHLVRVAGCRCTDHEARKQE